MLREPLNQLGGCMHPNSGHWGHSELQAPRGSGKQNTTLFLDPDSLLSWLPNHVLTSRASLVHVSPSGYCDTRFNNNPTLRGPPSQITAWRVEFLRIVPLSGSVLMCPSPHTLKTWEKQGRYIYKRDKSVSHSMFITHNARSLFFCHFPTTDRLDLHKVNLR